MLRQLLASAIIIACISSSASANLVGVDFNSTGGTPTNWTSVTGAGTTNNLIDESGAATAIDLNVNGPLFFSVTPTTSTVPTHPNSIANIGDNTYGYGSLTATFSDLVPNSPYEFYVFGLRGGAALSHDVTVTGSSVLSYSVAASSNVLTVNDELGSSSRTLASYADPITSSNTGTITAVIKNPSGSFFTVAGLAIQAVPEPSSFLCIGLVALGLVGFKRLKAL